MEKVKLIEIKKLFYSVVFWNVRVSENEHMKSFVHIKIVYIILYITTA